ncbi:hypothetical protein VP01_10113g1 [Puccinia sorghi]|uniref:Uncharacterized protein n=1 Tax=Puccinia sorghi TaxID=27349 RepID=A0A0L6VWE5_9BASI|nr:hypothetical protein VP01_10113g1 [Puccinia sorghi]
MMKVKGRKFDPKWEEGTLVGFNVPPQLYQIITWTGRVIESKHVKFLKQPESQPSSSLDTHEFLQLNPPEEMSQTPIEIPVQQTQDRPNHGESNDDWEESSETSEDEANIEKKLVQSNPTSSTPARVLRDRCQLKPPVCYVFHHYYEPNNFELAIRCYNAKYWRQAIEK